MKFISWNVNGLRAVLGKGFLDFFGSCGADFFCLQESKMQEGQAEVPTPGYYQFWSSAEKKGYSGTVIFARKEPLNVSFGVGGKYSDEGRLITLEYEDFYLVNSYTPNAQPELKRLDYRMGYEDDLRGYLSDLAAKKGVILCGDLNVAHQEIDLKNPGANVGNPGFSDEERGKFSELLRAGFTDAFRALYPDKTDAYTWWSYRMRARERNVGWRIDYFVLSKSLVPRLKDVVIRSDVFGSDHCPLEMTLA